MSSSLSISLIIPGTLGLVAVALLYLGVVLPTIWSRRPARRAAAHRTLGMLLRAHKGSRLNR
ncbi:hypothetical protein [Streptomyces sp. NPDC050528]|uniref:hypothetical protein n=1 Tax=Streptomyces sp. NPDC050528 TaxID=3365623 RepID=UPI00379C9E2E